MAKPDKLPRWASVDSDDPVTGQANKVEPTETKKNTGWAFLEKPPFNIFNWLFYKIYEWCKWVDENSVHSDSTLGTDDEYIIVKDGTSNDRKVKIGSTTIGSITGDISDLESDKKDNADFITQVVSIANGTVNTTVTPSGGAKIYTHTPLICPSGLKQGSSGTYTFLVNTITFKDTGALVPNGTLEINTTQNTGSALNITILWIKI